MAQYVGIIDDYGLETFLKREDVGETGVKYLKSRAYKNTARGAKMYEISVDEDTETLVLGLIDGMRWSEAGVVILEQIKASENQ